MRSFDFDDTDVAMITGGAVALASLFVLKADAKTIVMAYLTGLFGIVGLKNKKRGGGLPYGVES